MLAATLKDFHRKGGKKTKTVATIYRGKHFTNYDIGMQDNTIQYNLIGIETNKSNKTGERVPETESNLKSLERLGKHPPARTAR